MYASSTISPETGTAESRTTFNSLYLSPEFGVRNHVVAEVLSILSRSRLCSGSRNATGARGARVANGVPMDRGVRDVRENARVRRGREEARAAKASIIVCGLSAVWKVGLSSRMRAFREAALLRAPKFKYPFESCKQASKPNLLVTGVLARACLGTCVLQLTSLLASNRALSRPTSSSSCARNTHQVSHPRPPRALHALVFR